MPTLGIWGYCVVYLQISVRWLTSFALENKFIANICNLSYQSSVTLDSLSVSARLLFTIHVVY